MTRFILAAALAFLLAGSPLTRAIAEAGDGIAAGCVASFEARAKRIGKEDRQFPHRRDLCKCLQVRVKEDKHLSDETKKKPAQFYATFAKDPAAARKIQRTVPAKQSGRIRRHAGACTNEVMPK